MLPARIQFWRTSFLVSVLENIDSASMADMDAGEPQMRRRRCSESLTNTLPDAAKHANMFAHAPCSDTVLANIILSVRAREH